jgi:glucose-1-phosphate cytidylyltransferase
MFLANYSDDLADAPLDRLVENVRARPEVVGSFISVKPNLSLHCVDVDDSGAVTGVSMLSDRGLLVNGGYFVFRQGIFDVLRPGEELVEEPFARLIERRALVAHEHRGFWGPLDTLKDHQRLEELEATGEAPWKLWERAGSAAVAPGPTPAAAVDEAGAEGDDAAREVSTGA